jgi:hypothetical protein
MHHEPPARVGISRTTTPKASFFRERICRRGHRGALQSRVTRRRHAETHVRSCGTYSPVTRRISCPCEGLALPPASLHACQRSTVATRVTFNRSSRRWSLIAAANGDDVTAIQVRWWRCRANAEL